MNGWRLRYLKWVEDHPRVFLIRAWFWIVMIPIFIYLGWHTSVFIVFLYSSWANFSGDRGIYEAARVRQENNSDI